MQKLQPVQCFSVSDSVLACSTLTPCSLASSLLVPVQQPAAYLHELGHNLYLNHAGVNGDNGYGDYSAAMGFCCDLRCYNTPHSYQLGWVSPLDTLSVGSFGAGRWQRYTVPAHVTSPKNFIRINPDWVDSAAAYHMFISYR